MKVTITYKSQEYKFEFTPTMDVQDFISHNIAELCIVVINSNDDIALKLDWPALEDYVATKVIESDIVKWIMVQCFKEYFEDNF